MSNEHQIGITPAQVLSGGTNNAGFISNAVGAGLISQYSSNVQHAFDRIFFQNDSNLNGQKLTFFQVPIAGQYNVLNGGASTITKTAEDTNWDQANQAQYSYLFTGMYFKIQNLAYQSFLAAPNDLTTWPDTLKAIMEDCSLQIVMEDKIWLRQKGVHVPEGNAVFGHTAVTGTSDTPVGQPVVSNGFASASNIFGFGNMNLWVPKGSRFNVILTFGSSVLAASMAYKPATPKIFAEVRLQGVKFQAV